MIREPLRTPTGPNEWAIRLMWNSDGGTRILQMFQIQANNALPPENCKNKSPVTHARPQEKRKMGPVYSAQRLAFSPARETKWKSMWCSAHIMVHVFLCVSCFLCVHVCESDMCLCKRNYAYVCFHVMYMNH